MGWRVLWAVGMVVAVLTTALLIVDLRPEIWKDMLEGRVLTLVALGFSLTAIVVMLAIAGARRSWTGFQGKTVWDFLQLLIVPLMLVAIGLVFSLQQDARQQRIETQRADAERELAEQRAQDEALQAYLNEMSSLLLEKDLRESEEGSEVRTLARARTLTVLNRLDPSHKSAVMQFLIEAKLVQMVDEQEPAVALNGADLSGVDLRGLGGLHGAELIGADLSEAHLEGLDLSEARLVDADLSGAYLSGLGLGITSNREHVTDLSGANFYRADLSSADLSFTNLSDADLGLADLTGANLTGAYGITEKELEQQTFLLKGTTMPAESSWKTD
jgi:uncharacterized protein YjbI with pentapeptide repeats